MSRVIYCDVFLFELHQKVYLLDTETDESKIISICSIENLFEELFSLCNKHQVSNIHLFGNEAYLMPLAEKVIKNNQTQYVKSINIEVNKKCLNI